MRHVGIAGLLVLLSACGDSEPSRDTGSAAPAAASPAAPAVPAATAEPGSPAAAQPAVQEPLAARPVYLGGDAEMDACGSQSQVVARNGAKHAIVRSGPGTQYPVIDTLPLGTMVADCDMVEAGGGWTGVVYPVGGDVDCGTGSTIAVRQAYRGPCKFGWTDGELELIAG